MKKQPETTTQTTLAEALAQIGQFIKPATSTTANDFYSTAHFEELLREADWTGQEQELKKALKEAGYEQVWIDHLGWVWPVKKPEDDL